MHFSIGDSLSIGEAWNALSSEDQQTYLSMRNDFQKESKPSRKDRKTAIFKKEIQMIIDFIEHSPDGREARSIVSGIAIGGSFICVNTRQLKNFIARCKSSINVSFQDIGYIAVKTKAKAKSVVSTVIPSLTGNAGFLRQWTCRFCPTLPLFQSRFIFPDFPPISDSDLYEDKRADVTSPPVIDLDISNFDLSCFGDIGLASFQKSHRISQSSENLRMPELLENDSPSPLLPLERSKSEIFDLTFTFDENDFCFF